MLLKTDFIMKKTLLATFLIILWLPLFAQVRVGARRSRQPESAASLNLTSSLGTPFWVYIDDVKQTDYPVPSISLQGFPPGRFYVRVEMDNQDRNSIGRFITLNNQNLYLTIVQQGVLYCFQINNAGVHPQLTQAVLLNGQPLHPYPASGVFQPVTPCMNEVDFSEALRLIQKESFDSSRLALAKQIVSSNKLCARQIVEMCQKFSFESNRLEFAKFAYPFCSDQNKYYLVNQTFSYDSSKRELNAFINGE